MEVNIGIRTQNMDTFKIGGKNQGDVFIGGIPTSLNISNGKGDVESADLMGTSANHLLMNGILNTLAMSPLMLRSELPTVSFDYSASNGVWGSFAGNLFTANSTLKGSQYHGAVLDDIRNYVFYSNIKVAEHIANGLGGCINEDFFVYRNDVIPDEAYRRKTTSYIQRKPKTIQQVYPKEENKEVSGARALLYGSTVGKALNKLGVGKTSMRKEVIDGKEYQEMYINISYDYAESHGIAIDNDELTEDGMVVPANKMDILFYEIIHLASDLVSLKTHYPIVLLNCADYATIRPSKYIPLLRAFNEFMKKLGNGIVLYFNVDTSYAPFYDTILTLS